MTKVDTAIKENSTQEGLGQKGMCLLTWLMVFSHQFFAEDIPSFLFEG